jgi:indolepyruvate ferredoxin oxidoreductase
MFWALARMKRVRGTKLDPFGRDHVRKIERQLIAEFEEVLEQLATGLAPLNHETAVKVARLPDMIRGYDEVKTGNVDLYREQLRTLLEQFSAGQAADAVSAVNQ